MANYTLSADEVILYEGHAACTDHEQTLTVTLTSSRLILEEEVGTSLMFSEEIPLGTVKFYHDAAQIKQQGAAVHLQTTLKNITLTFSGIIEARKFTGKIINAATGTTLAQRGSVAVKGAIDLVDDTLGLDTRGALKSFLEQGVKDSVIHGIGPSQKSDRGKK